MNIERIKDAYKSNYKVETDKKLQELANKHINTLQLLEQQSTQYYYDNLFNNGRPYDIPSKLYKYIETNKSIKLEVAFINHIFRANSIPTDEAALTTTVFDGKHTLYVYIQYAKIILRARECTNNPIVTVNLTLEPIHTITLSDDEANLLLDSDNYREFGHRLAKNLIVNTEKLLNDFSEDIYTKFKDIFSSYGVLMYDKSNTIDSSKYEAYFRTTLYFKGNEYAEKTQIAEWLLDPHKSSFLEKVKIIINDKKAKLLSKLPNILHNDLLDDIMVNAIQNIKFIGKYLSLDFAITEDTTKCNDNTAIIKYFHFVLKDNQLYISIPNFYIEFEHKILYIPLSENELDPIDSITIPDNLNPNLVIPTLKSNEMYINLYKSLSLFDDHFLDEFETIIDNIFVNYGIKSGASVSFDDPYIAHIEVEAPTV